MKLLQFWALIAIPCSLLLLLAWRFKMGDRHLVRRTSIYFLSVFLVLPIVDYLIYNHISKTLAKALFLLLFLIGTAIYFALTIWASFRGARVRRS